MFSFLPNLDELIFRSKKNPRVHIPIIGTKISFTEGLEDTILYRSEKGHKQSRAMLKILQFDLWLELSWLELITSRYIHCSVTSVVELSGHESTGSRF